MGDGVNIRWSRVIGVLALAAVFAFAAVFVYRAVISSAGKEPDIWALLIIVATGVGVAICTVLVADIDKTKRGWRRWLTTKNIAILFLAVVAGGGAVPLIAAVFTPAPAVEDHPGQIRDTTLQTNAEVKKLVDRDADWPAFRNLQGYWGEERYGCRVVYHFERRDHGLTVTLVRKEPDMSDYTMTASITPSGHGDLLNATLRSSTMEDEKYGQALVFTYFDDGAIKRLGWLNETRSNAETKLEWCGESQ